MKVFENINEISRLDFEKNEVDKSGAIFDLFLTKFRQSFQNEGIQICKK